MKPENQVCTLEQGKKFNELGIMQGLSLFFWDSWGNNRLVMNGTPFEGYMADRENTCFSAFTVSELGMMLPDYLPSIGNLEIGKGGTDHISLNPTGKIWFNVSYWDWEVKSCHRCERGTYLEKRSNYLIQFPTLAEAMALMLIRLIESSLITVEGVNNRLKGV